MVFLFMVSVGEKTPPINTPACSFEIELIIANLYHLTALQSIMGIIYSFSYLNVLLFGDIAGTGRLPCFPLLLYGSLDYECP